MQRFAQPPLEARAAAEAAVAGLAALAPAVVVQVQPRPAAPVVGAIRLHTLDALKKLNLMTQ